MKNSAVKYQNVRIHLESAIRSGEFAAGEQLPPEQALADRFGVSYLTARRAVCELVEADLLERRARKGTFVRSFQTPQVTTLSVITSSYDHSLARDLIRRGNRLAEQHQWNFNVIRLSAGQQDAAVRAIRSGDLALVLLDSISPHSALGLAMRAAKGKALCLGSPTLEVGVPCILNDPDEIFQKGVDYLVDKGHRNIAFVGQSSLESARKLHQDAWRKATSGFFSSDEADARFIGVTTPLFQCPTHETYDAVHSFLLKDAKAVSAFVSFGEEITQGVLAAIRDCERIVPDDISVVNILDGSSMRFAHPPVTSIDVNFKRQFEIAFEILQSAQNGVAPPAKLHFVESRTIERHSVRPL